MSVYNTGRRINVKLKIVFECNMTKILEYYIKDML